MHKWRILLESTWVIVVLEGLVHKILLMWRRLKRPRIWTSFGTLPLLWNSCILGTVVSTNNFKQKMWRETWNCKSCERTSVIGFLVLSLSGKISNMYMREIGNHVLFVPRVDIINIILHFYPPSDLGEFPVMELPVYCLTLSCVFKYVLPSCDKETRTEAECAAPPGLIGILVFVEIPKWHRIPFPGLLLSTSLERSGGSCRGGDGKEYKWRTKACIHLYLCSWGNIVTWVLQTAMSCH